MKLDPHTYTETTTETTTKILSNKNIGESELDLKIFKKAVDVWNTFIDSDGKPIALNKERIKKLKIIFEKEFSNDINEWKKYVKKIVSSDFLMGGITDFKASFDWAIKESNILKVLEGAYANKVQKPTLNNQDYTRETTALQVKSYIERQENEIWKKTCIRIKERYGDEEFSSWFKDVEFMGCENDRFIIQTTTGFKKTWIEGHYVPFISRALDEITKGNLSRVLVKVRNVNSNR